MTAKTCRICGGPLPPRATTLCSDECRREERRESTRKAAAKHRAATGETWHMRYRDQRNAKGREYVRARRAAQPNVSLPCVVCGRNCTRRPDTDRTAVACAGSCRTFRRTGCHLPARTEWERTRRARFVAGTCAQCTAPFVVEDYSGSARFCSADCARKHTNRAQYERRRALEKSAFVENVDSVRVFQSDGYVCYLCGEPTDPDNCEWRPGADGSLAFVVGPKYPTLDHVVALDSGGTHEYANCRTAHHSCNSRKGNR